MGATLDEAIKERWDSQSLSTQFPGGIWLDRQAIATSAGGKPSFPCVIVDHIAAATPIWTSCSQFGVRDYQFSLYSTDKSTLETLVASNFKPAFDFAPLTLTGGQVLEFRPTNDDGIYTIEDGFGEVWKCILTYTAMIAKSVSYSPS